MQRQEFLKIVEDFLKNEIGDDLTKDTIILTDGGNGVYLNPNWKYYDIFGGYSLNSIRMFYAEQNNKKIKYIDSYSIDENEEQNF